MFTVDLLLKMNYKLKQKIEHSSLILWVEANILKSMCIDSFTNGELPPMIPSVLDVPTKYVWTQGEHFFKLLYTLSKFLNRKVLNIKTKIKN